MNVSDVLYPAAALAMADTQVNTRVMDHFNTMGARIETKTPRHKLSSITNTVFTRIHKSFVWQIITLTAAVNSFINRL